MNLLKILKYLQINLSNLKKEIFNLNEQINEIKITIYKQQEENFPTSSINR